MYLDGDASNCHVVLSHASFRWPPYPLATFLLIAKSRALSGTVRKRRAETARSSNVSYLGLEDAEDRRKLIGGVA